VVAFLAAGTASYIYWGLGYALGPMIAIFFVAEAERRGLAVDFPFLLGVTYGAQALWQYGPSSSRPLLVASPGHFLQAIIGVIPLSTTIWSLAAITHEVLYSSAAVLAACFLLCRWISQYPEAAALTKTFEIASTEKREALSFVQRFENSRIVGLAVAGLLVAWLTDHFLVHRLGHDINSLNATLLLLAFALYGSVKKFARAIEQTIGRSWAG